MAVFVWSDFLGPTVATSTHVLDVTVFKEDASQLARVGYKIQLTLIFLRYKSRCVDVFRVHMHLYGRIFGGSSVGIVYYAPVPSPHLHAQSTLFRRDRVCL